MAKELIDQIDIDSLEKSGCILPARSLRYKRTRRFLGWTEKFCAPRFYTLGTLKLAVKLLVSEHGLRPPLVGSFDLESWVLDQAKILHKLIRRAVKNSWDRRDRLGRAAMVANPDEVETQVLEERFVCTSSDEWFVCTSSDVRIRMITILVDNRTGDPHQLLDRMRLCVGACISTYVNLHLFV